MAAKNKLIEFSFVVLAVIAAWNLQLNSIAFKIAKLFGFVSGSFAEALTVGVFVPVSVALIAAIAQVAYRGWVWRLVPSSHYLGGPWVYVTIAQVRGAEVPTAGWFILKHNASGARIDSAKTYYLDADGLVFRGEWASDVVCVKSGEVWFCYHMRALGIEREPVPSEYRGFAQMWRGAAIGSGQPLAWTGEFNDLGDRAGIRGSVAAKTLKPRAIRGRKPEELIAEHVDDLMSSIRRRQGREKISYKDKE